jgi:hypothetical protein
MALILTATQQCQLSIAVVDAKGNPAPVEGIPEWASSEPAFATVTPAADGMSALVKAVGPITTAPVQVNVTADADLGAGTTPIVGLLEVSVVAGQAVSVGITAGTPEEQPAAPPAAPAAKKAKA